VVSAYALRTASLRSFSRLPGYARLFVATDEDPDLAVAGWIADLTPVPPSLGGRGGTRARWLAAERWSLARLLGAADCLDLTGWRERLLEEIAVGRVLDERGFIEVGTPILQKTHAGALARPFVTHHRAGEPQAPTRER